MNSRAWLLLFFLIGSSFDANVVLAMGKSVLAVAGAVSTQDEEDKRLSEMLKKLFDKNLALEFTHFCEKKPQPDSTADAYYILACWCYDRLGRIRDVGVVQQLFYDALSTGELSSPQKAMAQFKLASLLAKKHASELDKQACGLLLSLDGKELSDFDLARVARKFARRFANGCVVEKDEPQARKYFQMAIDTHGLDEYDLARVARKLARYFARGRGGEKDETRARKYFQMAIDTHELTEHDLAKVKRDLGILYADGRGGACDKGQARKLFQAVLALLPSAREDKRFCAQMKADIQYRLACLDDSEVSLRAVVDDRWTLPPELSTDVQFRLGMLYLKENNRLLAFDWLFLAVMGGKLGSVASARAEYERKLLSSVIDRQEIDAWERAAAQLLLAFLYADGRWDHIEGEKARVLLEEVLAGGNLREGLADYAKYRLALLLMHEGGAQNDTRARALLTEALPRLINTSHEFDTSYKLAVLLQDGRGGPRDEGQAIALLRGVVNGRAKDEVFKDDCLRRDVQQRLQKLCDTVRQFPIDPALLSGKLASYARFLSDGNALPEGNQIDELLKIVSAEDRAALLAQRDACARFDLRLSKPSQDGFAEVLYQLAKRYLGSGQKIYDTQNISKLLEAAILSWQSKDKNLKSRFQSADAQYTLVRWYQDGPFKNGLRERALLDGIDCNCLSFDEEADVYRRLGILYAKGEGGMQDNGKAQTLFEKAIACKVLDGGSCDEISSWVARLSLDSEERDLWYGASLVSLPELDPASRVYAQYRLGILYALGGRWQEWYDSGRKEIADVVGGPVWEKTINERAQAKLQEAIESRYLDAAQTESAKRYIALCRDFNEQKLLEQKVGDAQTTPNELALAQLKLATLYAHIKNGVYHDRRARELLNDALTGEKLSKENSALAYYERALLCDEHRGGVEGRGEAIDDMQAREFFSKAIVLKISDTAKLADAQYRLSRLLVLGAGGDANFEEAQKLLHSAINSGSLMPRQLAMAHVIVGAVGLRIESEKKRAQDAELFSRQLAAEEALIREPLEALQKRINSGRLGPAQLAGLQFQAAFLQYLDPSILTWEEGEDVKCTLRKVCDSGFLSRDRVALINHMLGEQKEEHDTWQSTELSIANDRANLGEDAILNFECERKIYEALIREHSSAFIQYKLACLYDDGRGGARDKKQAVELLSAAVKSGHLNALLVPDAKSRLDRLNRE